MTFAFIKVLVQFNTFQCISKHSILHAGEFLSVQCDTMMCGHSTLVLFSFYLPIVIAKLQNIGLKTDIF